MGKEYLSMYDEFEEYMLDVILGIGEECG